MLQQALKSKQEEAERQSQKVVRREVGKRLRLMEY